VVKRWLEGNPNAIKEQLEHKQKELEYVCNPVKEKM
jgi:hypothetical protein